MEGKPAGGLTDGCDLAGRMVVEVFLEKGGCYNKCAACQGEGLVSVEGPENGFPWTADHIGQVS